MTTLEILKMESKCKRCFYYDALIDGAKTPCDEEDAWHHHYFDKFVKEYIPDDIWKGKEDCLFFEER